MSQAKFLAITTILIVFFLTGVSRAQEFDELMGGKEIKPFPSYAIPITASITAPSPKSHIIPLVMDLVPLAALGGFGGYCATVSLEKRENYLGALYISGFVLLIFGSIPSHVYVGNGWVETVGLPVAKVALFAAATVPGAFSSIGNNWGGKNDNGASFFKYGTLPAFITTFSIYTYEIINHQLRVQEYNEYLEKRNQKTQAMITPLIWKDRMGLALQMSF
ncbi:MAG: hypothetical protein PHE84_07430 [bacterium]|nr:hypothetical protein [bacterium]